MSKASIFNLKQSFNSIHLEQGNELYFTLTNLSFFLKSFLDSDDLQMRYCNFIYIWTLFSTSVLSCDLYNVSIILFPFTNLVQVMKIH